MNAVPPVLQAQPSSGPVQPNPSDSAASAPARAGSQDFASALSDAGGKPARKNAASKQQDPSVNGSSLPPPGNQPPPAQSSPPPAKGAAAVVADAPVVAKGSPGTAQGPLSNGIAAASTTQANASDAAAILTAENLDTAATAATAAVPASAAAPALEAPPSLAGQPALPAGVDATTPSAAKAPSLPASGPTMPHAASARILATPGTSKVPTVAGALAGDAAKLADGTASPGTTASVNSTPSSAAALTDSTSTSGPGAAGTDAAAQAAMAAAVAQGTSASAPDSTFADDLATSDSDLPSGAAAVSGPAGGAPAAGASAAALAQASSAAVSAAAVSAAVTAATAASIAQAVSATGGAGAADKRSHANSPDSTLPGASSDGSVGAAQLLTSNTPTDNGPAPTFKVAAGVDTGQFGQGVADRVSLMMDGNLTSAKLQVNPPALGPIEVRIALQGGHAQVSFSSHSAVTRDALESSSEKLREMLGSQGFSSVSVDISQRSFQERSPQSQAYESAPSISADAPLLAQAPLSISRSASGLLDAYA
jgi:flagellar hook-length control protein FliK